MNTVKTKPTKKKKGISRPAFRLNRNEKVVLKLICLGYTTAKISKIIFNCKTNVKYVRSALFAKLQAKNAPNLIYIAMKHKLID